MDRSQDLNSYKWKALLIVALGSVMGTMDFGIANISFPVLTRVFKTDITTVMWVTLAYSLINICLMLFMGKISDIIGRKKIYVTGLAIFTIGMLLCSLSRGIGQLILYRSVQAIGSAMIIACGPAIIAEAFPPKELGKGLGIIQASVSFGFIIGPVLGGLLLSWLDWRSIFYIRVPVSLFVVLFSLLLLKGDSSAKGRIQFDYRGTIASSAGLFFLIFGVSQISQAGLGSPSVYIPVILGIAILGTFVFIETRAEDPIVDLTLFKIRIFSYSSLSLFFTFMAIPAYFLLMPFYLMEGLGLSPSNAGFLMAVTAVISAIISPFSGALSDKFGSVWFSLTGAVLTLAAYIFIHSFDLDTTVLTIVPVLVLLGISTGTFQTANNSTLMGAVPKNRLGTAAALIATKRNVGMSLGMAIAGTVYSSRKAFYLESFASQGMDHSQSSTLSVALAFQNTIFISLICLALVIIFSFLSGCNRPDN